MIHDGRLSIGAIAHYPKVKLIQQKPRHYTRGAQLDSTDKSASRNIASRARLDHQKTGGITRDSAWPGRSAAFVQVKGSLAPAKVRTGSEFASFSRSTRQLGAYTLENDCIPAVPLAYDNPFDTTHPRAQHDHC
jgi:hypothetical protein